MLDFEAMSPTKARRLNAIAKEFRPKFLDMVDALGEQNGHSLNWLLSSLASRDRYLSPLFERCCMLLLAEEALAEGERRFSLKDRHLAQAIRTLSRKIQVEVSIKNSIPLRQRAKEWAMPWIIFFHNILQLIRRFYARKYPGSAEKELILLDVFVVGNTASGMSIKRKKYQDRYFCGWENCVSSSEREKFRYFPVFSGFDDEGDAVERARESDDAFLIPDDYMRAKDYVWVAIKALGNLSLRLSDVHLAGISLKPILKAERYALFSNSSVLAGFFLYRFSRQSAAMGLSVKRLVGSNENQILDKGLTLGFQRYHANTKIVAFKGWPLSEDCNPHHIPSPKELEKRVHPEEIWVAGERYKTIVHKHAPNVAVHVGPSLRFGCLRKIKVQSKSADSLLIGLSVSYDECEDMLSMLRQACPLFPKRTRIVIKPHPLLPREHLAERITLDCNEWEWTTKKLEEDLVYAKCYFTSASVSVVEALAAGVPVIVVGSCRGLSWDYTPDAIPQEIRARSYSPSEFVSAFQQLSECPQNVKQTVADHIRKDYYPGQTLKSVRQLFGLPSNVNKVRDGN